MIVIAITGYKRCGKDTAAYLIRKNCNVSLDRYSFADPVREVAMSFFGWSPSVFLDDLKEVVDPQWGISPRQALQFIGTEVGRVMIPKTFPEFNEKTGDSIWIKRFKNYIKDSIPQHAKGVTIPDMRFINEFNAVTDLSEEHKVITIAIERDGLKSDGHASEDSIREVMDMCTYTIRNNGNIGDLERVTQNILFEHDLLKFNSR